MTLWLRRIAVVLVLAAGFHALAVWALPRMITTRVMSRGAVRMGINQAYAQDLPTDKSRLVVQPSPDLLYAICLYDISTAPLLLESDLPKDYWSLSVFALNSDNVFAVNDQQVQTRHPRYILARDAKPTGLPPDLADVPVIVTPSSLGVVLFRNLVLDPTDMADARAAQKSAKCTAVAQ